MASAVSAKPDGMSMNSRYRTQMTLIAGFASVSGVIGPHSRYWYKKHQLSVFSTPIAALESETLLQRR
ncbi:hypothetical protein [Paenibacillus sp. FSL E2-0177]|uniref:hypothetical protein n=1 Tax=Paenibacillus sp. FSL E2-0177 TaxID=2921360 RepID=UPI0030EC44CB